MKARQRERLALWQAARTKGPAVRASQTANLKLTCSKTSLPVARRRMARRAQHLRCSLCDRVVGLQPTVIASRAPHLLLEQSDSKNRGRASPVNDCGDTRPARGSKLTLDLSRTVDGYHPSNAPCEGSERAQRTTGWINDLRSQSWSAHRNVTCRRKL